MSLGQAERDRLDAAETVLVLASAGDDAAAAVRRRLLADSSDPHLLAVVLSRPADEWVADWERTVGPLPDETVIVTPATDGESTSATVEGATVESVAGPTDFTGLGVRLTEHVGRWRESDADVRLSFDSLTDPCHRAGVERVYKFLHVLVGHLHLAGARAQFHLDADAVDEQTVATLLSLFDGVAAREGDGWSVRTRPSKSRG